MSEEKPYYTWPRGTWQDDETFDEESELKTAHPEACAPGEHTWRSSFVFSVQQCNTCKARRRRKR